MILFAALALGGACDEGDEPPVGQPGRPHVIPEPSDPCERDPGLCRALDSTPPTLVGDPQEKPPMNTPHDWNEEIAAVKRTGRPGLYSMSTPGVAQVTRVRLLDQYPGIEASTCDHVLCVWPKGARKVNPRSGRRAA